MSSYNNKKSKVIIRACPKDPQRGTPAASRIWYAKENTPIFYGYEPISTRSYLPSKTVDKLNAINTFKTTKLGHVLKD
jgi:hypothetical protein